MEKTHMGEYIKLKRRFDKEAVLTMVECYKDNPSYASYSQLFDELVEQYLDKITPKGYVEVYKEQNRIECLVTLGPDCDRWIREAFDHYMYLEGMLLNSLFDMMLYEASNQLYETVKTMVPKGKHLSMRYEPGQLNVPMQEQRYIFERLQKSCDLQMSITQGCMLNPTKSTVYYYELVDYECAFGIDHDCSHCQTPCSNKKHTITIKNPDSLQVLQIIQGKKGENILDVLRQNHCFVDAPCGGKKVCGKCKIQVEEHEFCIEDAERAFLGEHLVEEGFILACYHELDRDLVMLSNEIGAKEEMNTPQKTHIEAEYTPYKITEPKYPKDERTPHFGVAIDIGTTTIVVSLIDLVSKETIATKKVLNPQKAYGADVISRIQYVNEHKEHDLGTSIRNKLWELTKVLLEDHAQQLGAKTLVEIEEMVISGNTTMIYLLLDIVPEKLAIAPFETVCPPPIVCSSQDVWDIPYMFDIVVIPWVSAYVGGDIVSGMYMMQFDQTPGNNLFIDIGTNGEMAIKTENGLVSAATAAGPAFEGANIKCGMGSVDGAICEIHRQEEGYGIVTLGGEKAIGINGSALVDGVALLLEDKKVNAMGYMESPEMIFEHIGFYPEDIRQLQLAKSAICAGVDVLIDEAGIQVEDIDTVYIAGGFGSHLNIKHAITIGLIPKALESKVNVIGNASLGGAIRCLLERRGKEKIVEIAKACQYLELSSNYRFNTAYMERMIFEME